jgi:putative hydrolase of the HAD superfamily
LATTETLPVTQHPFDPPPRAILFDLDDTLCDYAAARERRLRFAFSLGPGGRPRDRAGVDLDRMIADSIRMHPHGADHFGELFANYGIHGEEDPRRAADWYRRNRFHGLELFPEAAAVLREVRTAASAAGEAYRRPLALITNGPTEVQRAKVDLLGIGDLIDFVLISEEFGSAKPEPEIFHAALDRMGVDRADAVFVGDSPEFDMAGARAAGLRSVWVNRQGRPWQEEAPAPHRIIRSLDELPDLLR